MRPMSSDHRRGWLPLCVALGLGATLVLPSSEAMAQAPSAPSAGDLAQARVLLNQGLDLRNRGDSVGALEKLKTANTLARTPIIGLELGRTYEALGQLVEARETLLGVARIPLRAEETQRSKAARASSDQMAEQIRPRIPTLTVKVTGAPESAVSVSIDGVVVPSEALEARPVDPGHHVISAKPESGGSSADASIDLKEGETREVDLKVTAAAPLATEAAVPLSTAPVAAPPESGTTASSQGHSHVLPWALIGGGVVVGAAGAVLMGVESGKAGDANSAHDRSSYDSAKTAWTIGLVGAIVGGAAVATGGVVFIVQGRKTSGQEGRAATWINVGINQVDVRGTW
jgi:hypothetical protein